MICCVTGHRPQGFPFGRNEKALAFLIYINKLYEEIENLVNEGYTHFITGMAAGADRDFAEAVIHFRFDWKHLFLEAALPYPISPKKAKSSRSEERDGILAECNSTHIISSHYHRGCMQKRNRYMVDKSDLILAIWNGKTEGGTWNTIKYARLKNKPIRYIMLDEIEEDFLRNLD